MNIEEERKAFEAWYKGKISIRPNFKRLRFAEDEYECEDVDTAWSAWQASANREGFVLVPKEPTLEMCHRGRNTRSFKVQDIYKAMIEAQEQSDESN